jgi:hypothetical protein
MTRTDEFIGFLEDYLDTYEGPTPMPEALRDAIRAELPVTRQRRSFAGTRGLRTMTSTIPRPLWVGLAAAAAVIAIAVGVGVGSRGAGTGTPTPAAATQTPTTGATPAGPAALRNSPSVTSAYGAGYPPNISPGTYYLDAGYPATVSIDVPPGWFLWDAATDFNGVLRDSADAPSGSGWGLVVSVVDAVYKNPCNQYLGTIDATTPSVDAFVAAVSAWPGVQVSESSPMSMDGFAGQMIKVRSTVDVAGCPVHRLWETPSGYAEDGYGLLGSSRHEMTYRFLQVGRSVLVIRTTDFPETSPFEFQQGVPFSADRHAVDQMLLQAMVDSIHISTS